MISMEFIESNLLKSYSNRETRSLKKLGQKPKEPTNYYESLKWTSYNLGVIKTILEFNILDCKNEFNKSAMCQDIFLQKNGEAWLPLQTLMYLSLSDHQAVLDRIAKARNIELYADERGWMGELNAFYNILEGDWDGLKETILYLKNMRGDYHDLFYPEVHFILLEGFARQDIGAIEYALNELESKKYEGVRANAFAEEKYISFASLAYAKQAWKHGMPIWGSGGEIKGVPPKIPAAWLPYEPLEEYTIPYRFLRDFYREQGIDWRYDPVYPELQDWDCDPENPKI